MNNKICAKCNQSNQADMRFCGNCGAEFSPQISADDLPPTILGGIFGAFPPPQNFQQPNFPPQPQNFAPPPPQFSPQASLRIDFAGVWLLVDTKVEVYFDNQFIGTGSVKNGFSFTFNVASGTHILELKTALTHKRYEFTILAGGNFGAQINFNRAMGRFSSDLNFNCF